MGKRADPLAFWSARSMDPSMASPILMWSTRLLCLVSRMVTMVLKEETHLSIMAMTAETFNFVACSIATLASAFATGNFKSRSPSWEGRALNELEI